AFALKSFPKTPDELKRYKVVVMGNVPTTALAREGPRNDMKPAAGGRSDQWLVDYVAQGGGLLVLGGSFSFDLESTTRAGSKGLENTYKDSALAQILPVELAAKGMTVADQNKPLELTPATPHTLLKGVDFTPHPMTLFYHPLSTRKEGTVVLTAGKDGPPILVLGTFGKGRVAVFLATLHGDPAKESTPYWEWQGWPVLTRNLIDWLGQQG
ncbi:MAG: glutamine amidotransferase, partial [Phycisphaerae bacterium]